MRKLEFYEKFLHPIINHIETWGDQFLTKYLGGIIVILCAIIVGKIVYKFWAHQSRLMKAAESFPGPRTIPLLGNILNFIFKHENVIDTLIEICQEYPLNRLWIGPRLIINVTTPEDIEVVINSSKCAKKSFIYKLMEPTVVDGLINGHGSRLRAHRKLLIPIINGEHLIDYMKVINKQFRRHVDALSKKVDSGEFDIHQETECCMADIAFETLFGIPGVGQDFGDLTFPRAVNESLEIFFYRCTKLWLHPRFLFDLTKSGKRSNKLAKYLTDFVTKIVNEKKKLYAALARGEPGIEKPKPSVLDVLMENVRHADTINDEDIVTEITTSFIGFFDTMLGLFAFMMLMLAMNHKAQEKVREEVIAVLGSNIDVMEENLGALKYTDLAIRETIRLFPIGSIISREATDDLKLGNRTVPKGATIVMIPHATHRSEKYWEQPNAFIPERLLPKNSTNRPRFAFIPFSGGPRMCPGFKLGMACLKIFAAHFIRSYQLTTTMKIDDLKLTQVISIRSASGYPVSIKKISQP